MGLISEKVETIISMFDKAGFKVTFLTERKTNQQGIFLFLNKLITHPVMLQLEFELIIDPKQLGNKMNIAILDSLVDIENVLYSSLKSVGQFNKVSSIEDLVYLPDGSENKAGYYSILFTINKKRK